MSKPLVWILDTAFSLGIMLWGLYTTFSKWGISKSSRIKTIIIYLIFVLMLSGLLHSVTVAMAISVILISCAFEIEIHRMRALDAWGLWLLVGETFVLWTNTDASYGYRVIAILFLLGGFVFLRQYYAPHLYRRFGQVGMLGILISSLAIFVCFHGNHTINYWITLLMALGSLVSWIGLTLNKNKARKPLLLFDLDGTLIDSQPLVFETFRQVFARLKPGYPLSDKELYSFFGPTLETTFGKYFAPDEIEEVIALYQQINLDLHKTLLKEMPHALETIQHLAKRGYTMGIVSNKRRHVVELGLEQSGLKPYMSAVFGKEDQPACKPKPDGLIYATRQMGYKMDEVLYFGDNAADIQAAKGAAFFEVGYTLDKVQQDALFKTDPCVLLTDLREIETLLEEDRLWIDKSIW